MKEQPIKHVGIWIRVSTEDQAQGESPEHHEKRARYYAESKGWKVKEVYNLAGVSGKDVTEHPETKRMQLDIKSGHITGLIFSKLARLARNTRQLLDFADYFNKYDADLISLQEAIDTSTPAGRLFYTMIAAMAQWEREEIASRVAASIPIRAKLGKPLGAAPFGYQWKDKQLLPDPKEAPIRKLMYELFKEHRRKKTVARMLNDMGHRTRNGSKFSDTTIHRLLEDPCAKGMRRANYTKSTGRGKKWEFKPQTDWVMVPCPAIVSEELWNQCNAILQDMVKGRKIPTKRPVYLFTGYVFCHCGQKMTVPSGCVKYTCPKCRNKMGIADLEAVFHTQIEQFFHSSEVDKYLEQADRILKEKAELLESLGKEQQKVKEQMDRIMQLYLSDQITKEGFGREYKPLEERLKQLGEQIPEIQGGLDFLKVKLQNSDEVLSEAKSLYSRWIDLKGEEKRSIVEQITDNIIVGQGDIAINLCYLPSSSEIIADGQRDSRAALPFCNIRLHAEKPKPFSYPEEPKTLGEHIRKRRMDLGLLQRDAAQQIGTTAQGIVNWENNLSSPRLGFIPRVYDFLGYCPWKPTPSLSEKLKTWRTALGMSHRELAQAMGVDPSSIADWEVERHTPVRGSRKIIREFFESRWREG